MIAVSTPLVLSRFGSLVKNENQPSTSLDTSGEGSNWAGTLVTLAGSMPLALRNAFHTGSLVACTPIFLPIMSCGVLIGAAARLMIANGFFWYCAPTKASWLTFGPPAIRLTLPNPAAV